MSQSDKIKRMAVFVEHFPPYLGSDRSVFELAKRVAESGVQVHFIVTQPLRYLVGHRPKDWRYTENWRAPPPKIHKNISAEYLLLGRRLQAMWQRFPPLAFFLTLILFTVKSLRELVRFGPSIVIAAHASPIVGVVAFLSAKISSLPLLMGCPDWISAYAAGLASNPMNSFGPVFLQMVEFRLYKWSNQVFAATYYLKKLLISRGVDSESIVVIPNGVDINVFNPDVDSSEIRKKYRLEKSLIVLFSGHLENWAGVDLIYDLAERLNQDVPNSTILLVGSGDSTSRLFERLVHANLGHMLTHAGFHPYEEMPKFTALSDVTLCIFPDTAVAHAASPLKLFEYLASGRAVVATRVAGTAEVLDDTTGMLVEPGDIEGICDAVIKLSSNPELRKSLGIRGRKHVEEHYSWDLLAGKFLEVCKVIISGG